MEKSKKPILVFTFESQGHAVRNAKKGDIILVDNAGNKKKLKVIE